MPLAVCCITSAISTEYSAAGDATTGTAPVTPDFFRWNFAFSGSNGRCGRPAK